MTSQNRGFGCQSMTGVLRRVVVRRPDESFAAVDPAEWGYLRRPNLAAALEEHAAFVDVLIGSGVEVIYQNEKQPDRADAIYTHDSALITSAGAIILRMGKTLRRGEEESMESQLRALDVPILRHVIEPGQAEGGDLLWFDETTLAIGVGFRTNMEGARQLAQILNPLGIATQVYQLPYYKGPSFCLHLMSLLSLVDRDLAVIHPQLMPVSLWQELVARGIKLIEVPEDEFESQATNVLAIAPRKCVMLRGNPVTERRLRAARCEVTTFSGEEISFNSGGGPTCLTRPIWRDTP